MMIADSQHTSKDNHTITEWVLKESAVAAQEILQRVTPAVRQAMTTLEAIETGTQTLMQSIGRQITEALMAVPVPASLGVCRDCEQPLRRVDAHRPRSITGIVGDYHWTRPYAVCPQGHGSAAPQDQVLQLGPGQVSPKLAAMLARMAIDVPFDPVPDILAHTLGLALDGEMVRRVAENVKDNLKSPGKDN